MPSPVRPSDNPEKIGMIDSYANVSSIVRSGANDRTLPNKEMRRRDD